MNIVISFLAGLVAGGVLATLYHTQIALVEAKVEAKFAKPQAAPAPVTPPSTLSTPPPTP